GDALEEGTPKRYWAVTVDWRARDFCDVVFAAIFAALAGAEIDGHFFAGGLKSQSSASHWSAVSACRRSALASRSTAATVLALATAAAIFVALGGRRALALRQTARARSNAISVWSRCQRVPDQTSHLPQSETWRRSSAWSSLNWSASPSSLNSGAALPGSAFSQTRRSWR